jgi:hypothetical protein
VITTTSSRWASLTTEEFDLTNLQFHRPKTTESEWLTSKSYYAMVEMINLRKRSRSRQR